MTTCWLDKSWGAFCPLSCCEVLNTSLCVLLHKQPKSFGMIFLLSVLTCYKMTNSSSDDVPIQKYAAQVFPTGVPQVFAMQGGSDEERTICIMGFNVLGFDPYWEQNVLFGLICINHVYKNCFAPKIHCNVHNQSYSDVTFQQIFTSPEVKSQISRINFLFQFNLLTHMARPTHCAHSVIYLWHTVISFFLDWFHKQLRLMWPHL